MIVLEGIGILGILVLGLLCTGCDLEFLNIAGKDDQSLMRVIVQTKPYNDRCGDDPNCIQYNPHGSLRQCNESGSACITQVPGNWLDPNQP